MLANKRKNSYSHKDDSDTKNHKSKSKIKNQETKRIKGRYGIP